MSNRVFIALLSVALVLFAVPVEFAIAACWTTETVTEPAQYCAPCDEEKGCEGAMRTQIQWQKCVVATSDESGMSECKRGDELTRVGYAYVCTQSTSPSALASIAGAYGVCLVACILVETGIGLAGCAACLAGWSGLVLHGGNCGLRTPCAKDDDYKSAIYKTIPELGGDDCQIGG